MLATRPSSSLQSASAVLLTVAALMAFLVLPSDSRTGVSESASGPPFDSGSKWIRVEEGSPLLVPADHAFILTGLGNGLQSAGSQGIFTYLFMDDAIEVTAKANMCCGNSTTIKHVPTGFTAHAGSLIHVEGQAAGNDGRAWGYLVRASAAPDFVIVREGSPFVVPAGKDFRLSGVGSASIFGIGYFSLNGQIEVISGTQGSGIGTSVMDVPIGFEAEAGDTLEVFSNDTVNGRAWGHLVDS